MFNYITLISALSISSVAIYYSVAGLATIFAASAIQVIIMGTVLELGKLAAVVWLHKNWHHAIWWLKYYLSAAVLVLMLITSVGIYGYLSKSHIEQTASSQESVAQSARIKKEIAINNAIISRAESKIKGFELNGSDVDASLAGQIDKEQQRINHAYDRVKPVIAEQLAIIQQEEDKAEKRTKPYRTAVQNISKLLSDLQTAVNTNNIKKAQGIVGTNPDGKYGPATARTIEAFRSLQDTKRSAALTKIDNIVTSDNDTIKSSRSEISRIRATVQSEINESNLLIKRLRNRIGKSKKQSIEELIEQQQLKITTSNNRIDVLTQDQFTIEAQYRKLEAEVGPIKYIAEFIYEGEADANLLEKAVRWVILLIIFVFDPLAVLLLIATQYSFERAKKEVKPKPLPTTPTPTPTPTPAISQYNIQLSTSAMPLAPVEKPKENTIGSHIKTVWPDEEDSEPLYNDLNELSEIAQQIKEDNKDETVQAVQDLEGEPDITDTPSTDTPPTETSVEEEVHEPEVEELVNREMILVKTAEDYVTYAGKRYSTAALIGTFPEMNFDFTTPVRFGNKFPGINVNGELYLNTDTQPTRLYRFNGLSWDPIDKNLLESSAYSTEYLNHLINSIAINKYNHELLNEEEKHLIEDLLLDEE